MPRTYTRKTQKATAYSKPDLLDALNSIRLSGIPVTKAAEVYKIPVTTLRDHLSGRRGSKCTSLGRPTEISPIEESRNHSVMDPRDEDSQELMCKLSELVAFTQNLDATGIIHFQDSKETNTNDAVTQYEEGITDGEIQGNVDGTKEDVVIEDDVLEKVEVRTVEEEYLESYNKTTENEYHDDEAVERVDLSILKERNAEEKSPRMDEVRTENNNEGREEK
ncbi:hypothetical protein GE061_000200 [Apolygus lucorum]|uniref:HTH psq-type domain-containing protein n=1 Tax=Apolygus lucorum TaxID=248454 RepID=A0A8S9Y7Q4_APOLU|nr:hypothetical protein GE061_000200 [Apolygus lucorum]